ncbi:MAG: vitamin K epoxide reductase family protein [Deltaproteobacteria bacterium]|nr:vitamin K epoxide reductase family protein [Deltaproteobacteria bacterium]
MRFPVLVNILGVFISLVLASKELGSSLPFCEIGETLSCEAVLNSNFSTVFGVPNSVLGFFLYSFLALAFWFRRNDGKTLAWVYVILSCLAGSVTIYLFYVSWFIIGFLCLYCVATYIINFVNLFCSVPVRQKFIEQDSWLDLIKPLFLSLVATGGLWLSISQFGGQKIELTKILVVNSERPVSPISYENERPVIAFVDPVCPACIRWKMAARDLYYNASSKVKNYYFPLDKKCNPSVATEMHRSACFLSKVLICAEKLGSVSAVENALYTRFFTNLNDSEETLQRLLSEEFPNELSCSKGVDSELQKHISKGIEYKLIGTPTIYFEGKLVDFRKVSMENFARFLTQSFVGK